jgi:hypothetical protein
VATGATFPDALQPGDRETGKLLLPLTSFLLILAFFDMMLVFSGSSDDG